MLVTKTVQELVIAQDNGLALYATPNSDDSLGGYYWASSPSWANDVCVATVQSFLEYEGYDILCRDDDYLELNESYSCEVATSL